MRRPRRGHGPRAVPDQVLPRLHDLHPARRGRRLPLSLGARLPRPGHFRAHRDVRVRRASGRRVRLRLEGRRARLVAPVTNMELTPERRARFEKILAQYPVKRSALLPLLHLIQEQEGYLHTEGIELAARLLSLSPAQVHDTASFYTMYRWKP